MTEQRIQLDQKIETSAKKPEASQFIFIRHGQSRYTERGRDLTDTGVKEIESTAKKLKSYLEQFDHIIILSSPATRAKGSAEVFLKILGVDEAQVKTVRAVKPFEIKQLEKFLQYDREHSTPIYGQMWLTDPFLSQENPLVESRTNVQKRAGRFIYHYGRFIDRVAREKNIKIGVLVFSHMEVGMNYLQGLFPESENFPITENSALQNAEPIIIQLDDPQKDSYTIIARDKRSSVRYSPTTNTFVNK